MSGGGRYDAVIVGAGPNGLAAAIELARNGCAVAVLEANEQIGGCARSGELTLPGFVHDLGAAIHPLGVASPFFRSLPLEKHGLAWIHPAVPLAHPFDDGTATLLERSIDATAAALGTDAAAYRHLMDGVVDDVDRIAATLVGSPQLPRHPLALAIAACRGLRSARGLAESLFIGERARGLFAGISAHSFLPLEQGPSALFGLVLGVLGHAHGCGWPIARGGSQTIVNALASCLRSLGGEIFTGVRVTNVDEVPPARAILFDLTPRQLLAIGGLSFPKRYRRTLKRYRYGPGVFKMDFALDGPIPWQAEACLRAGTVHLGGTLAEIAAGEADVWRGKHPAHPFVLLAQQSLFDETRAPAGMHTAWAYCHVPNGSTFDMTERIETQIERFAPGFRDRILAKHAMTCADLERINANLVGGDINGGIMDFRQLLTRPTLRLPLHSTPAKGIYLCSSSTPPGGGVHGLCGYLAARAALRDLHRS